MRRRGWSLQTQVPSSSQRVQPQNAGPGPRGAQTLSISCATAAETVAFQFAKRVLESDLAWLPLADGLLLPDLAG